MTQTPLWEVPQPEDPPPEDPPPARRRRRWVARCDDCDRRIWATTPYAPGPTADAAAANAVARPPEPGGASACACHGARAASAG
ncbi:hypothetical protein [Sphaerisporangium album]|uniref:hypothetical protein n=1 Tax=Sphaerisporangium album TaxID=509200 RepID=UPI0011C07D5C|nr:hypothetical protein [Sphaerisporangium album]